MHVSGQFRLWDEPAGNHGYLYSSSWTGYFFDKFNYHDSLQARLVEEIGHYVSINQI